MDGLCLKNNEKIIFSLRSLYQKYGYHQYQMSKFEEYDLYIKNKDFLVSDNIITFTDTDGKLLALKPDVTLSVIKNMNYDLYPIHKVYYDEKVYRVSKGTNSFKEITQAGLECIGSVDDYTILETLILAAKSLELISADFIMDISHIGIVSEIIEKTGASINIKKEILKCLEEKNLSALSVIESRENLNLDILRKLIKTYGSTDKVTAFLKETESIYKDDFIKIVTALENSGFKNKVRIDFSITGDTNYYNGFIFKGFINGVPSSVLSGGQYDNLMSRFGKSEKAIGFAVYIDMIERLSENPQSFDVDTVLIYDNCVNLEAVNDAITNITLSGRSVLAQSQIPSNISYRQLVKLTKKGVEIIENNA